MEITTTHFLGTMPSTARIPATRIERVGPIEEGDIEPTASVLYGFVALTRYCRFSLFGFKNVESGLRDKQKKDKRRLSSQEITHTCISVPKDFSCPITLDLMTDPVIISTGQTYDRSSITRWMEEGHCTCPKTGQVSIHT
ncbi:U-box domain-containing protein [Heracleum sosnowskyi]|uniref:U-box domain-containing protein n=1 Tax=Heracleum sosnowskyi TaxID=360622 RepID=A0AAD8MXU3_9APIA|nr:U-box domain-containing protein [Heracleum sosnowskyi]